MSTYVERYRFVLVALMLTAMLAFGVISAAGDAGTVDEVAHVPSGYSYLKYGDYRLNPEHPPLLKDLAGFPLLFMDLEFPDDIPPWTEDINGQWESGWHFLYHYGNDADKILFYSRMPLLLLAVGFGLVLYRFVTRRLGWKIGLLTLFFYAFSPNVLAHARLVTTDVGIMVFIFIAFIFLFKFLENPRGRNLILLAVALALAELAKFSAVILYPFFALLTLIFVLVPGEDPFMKRLFTYGGKLAGVFGLSLLMIWAFYVPHTINMPEDVQDRLISGSLAGTSGANAAPPLTELNGYFGMKPLVQYALGVVMVVNRVEGGNTTYYLGEVTNQSFMSYFPVTYLIKMQISFLLLNAAVILWAVWLYLKKEPLRVVSKFAAYARDHFVELSSLLFIAFYSYISITGNLNLGIRHLMPMMPFLFLATAKGAVSIYERFSTRIVTALAVLLLAWYALAYLLIYPFYIAYFNEGIGGPGSAYKYVSDSSVDWGQDLKRLKIWVDENPDIDKIAVDYFGGGEPKYYFCERRTDGFGNLIKDVSGYDCSNSKFVEWHAEYGLFEEGKYLAVSETFLMNDLYWASLRGDTGYSLLREMEPVAKIGYSIYVYKLR